MAPKPHEPVYFWDFDVSDDENHQRLQGGYQKRQLDDEVTKYADLNHSTRLRLTALDHRLVELEQWIEIERQKIATDTRDKTVFVGQKFELRSLYVRIDFKLDESDPCYNDADDCYIYRYRKELSLSAKAYSCQHTPRLSKEMHLDGLTWSAEVFSELVESSGVDLSTLARVDRVFVGVLYEGMSQSNSFFDPNDHEIRKIASQLTWDPDLPWRRMSERIEKDAEQIWARRKSLRMPLSPAIQAHCLRINEYLRELEEDVFHTEFNLITKLNPRVGNPSELLDDYEIDFELDSYLTSTDPISVASGNRLLLRQKSALGDLHKKITERRLAKAREYMATDWCERHHGSASFDPPHCYTYHDLYDHHHLDIRDVARIEYCTVRCIVELQRFVSVMGETEHINEQN